LLWMIFWEGKKKRSLSFVKYSIFFISPAKRN